MNIKISVCAIIMGLTLLSEPIYTEADQNIQIMIDAARQLSWNTWMGGNRANLLVKQETVVAPVAVVSAMMAMPFHVWRLPAPYQNH